MSYAGAAPQSVPPTAYLWIPVAVGGGLAVLLVLVTGIVGIPYTDDREEPKTARLFRPKFWEARFYASAAWTFADSGATNVAALGTALATVLASGTVLSSLFTIDLAPFVVMNIACGGAIAAAPILFGIINFFVMRGNPLIPADARLKLAAKATITLPSGASIAVPGGATIKRKDGGTGDAQIKAGGTIPLAPGTVITVKPDAVMALPSGNTIAICPGATLTLDTDTRLPAGSVVPAEAAEPPLRQRIHDWFGGAPEPGPPRSQVSAGDEVVLTEGATATVTGAADIFLPAATTCVAPGRRGMRLKANSTITVPSGANVMAAGMGSVLAAAVLTTFGIGAEIGLVAVLAAHYSPGGHVAAVVISAVVAAGLLLYGATSIRSLANPTTGTSLSSGTGTSFTL